MPGGDVTGTWGAKGLAERDGLVIDGQGAGSYPSQPIKDSTYSGRMLPMSNSAEQAVAAEIVTVGRWLGAQGWVPATAGNFSARIDEARIGVTRSGVDKGELVMADILPIAIHQPPPKGSSAETPLHLALYRDRPDTGCVLHTHSVASTLLSMIHEADGTLRLRDYELLKALRGVDMNQLEFDLPIFPNDQDIPRLAEHVSEKLADQPGAVGYLIAGHGLYAWGRTVVEAKRHVVAFEFLLSCELERMRIAR